MKNKINEVILKSTSDACKKMAYTVSASACYFSLYQPKEPKILRNKNDK